MERREFILAPALAAARPADWVSSRPRLYFDVAALKQLKARIARSNETKQDWSRLLSRAETLLENDGLSSDCSAGCIRDCPAGSISERFGQSGGGES